MSQQYLMFCTYLEASGLGTPTMVRVCPTLKDMFFMTIPCAEKEGVVVIQYFIVGKYEQILPDPIIIAASGHKNSIVVAATNSPALTSSVEILKHVFSIMLPLTERTPTISRPTIARALFLHAEFGRCYEC